MFHDQCAAEQPDLHVKYRGAWKLTADDQVPVKRKRLPVALQEIPLRTMEWMHVRRMGGPTTQVVAVCDSGKHLTLEGEYGTLTSVCKSY